MTGMNGKGIGFGLNKESGTGEEKITEPVSEEEEPALEDDDVVDEAGGPNGTEEEEMTGPIGEEEPAGEEEDAVDNGFKSCFCRLW